MSKTNGNGELEVARPTLGICWNADAQGIEFKFDPQEFKSWDFIKALLGMAQERVAQIIDQNQKMATVQALQEQQQGQALAQKLLHGR